MTRSPLPLRNFWSTAEMAAMLGRTVEFLENCIAHGIYPADVVWTKRGPRWGDNAERQWRDIFRRFALNGSLDDLPLMENPATAFRRRRRGAA